MIHQYAFMQLLEKNELLAEHSGLSVFQICLVGSFSFTIT